MLKYSPRYLISHCLELPIIKMRGEARTYRISRYCVFVSNLSLLLAIALGLYVRWMVSQSIAVTFVIMFGLFVFALSSILFYYFRREDVSSAFAHIWFGSLLAMICFTDIDQLYKNQYYGFEAAMNALFLTSLGFRLLASFFERLCGRTDYHSVFLTNREAFQVIGFSIGCIVVQDYFASLWLLSLAYVFTLISVRLKVLLGLPYLAAFYIITSLIFFSAIQVSPNIFALACFAGQLAVDPVLDLYFCRLSLLERWECLLSTNRYLQKLALLAVLGLQLAFCSLAGLVATSHEEWYLAIPLYALFALLWVCLHLVFLLTAWTFSSRVAECVALHRAMVEESRSLGRVMASKGLRYFSLMAERFVLFAHLTTVMLVVVSWEVHSPAFLALFLLLAPLEATFLGLLHDLGNSLGGTCTGYALVGPANFHRVDREVVLLPPNTIQENSMRCTEIISCIQQFFFHHMITIQSCDYSSSGLSADALEAKLKMLFRQRISDGPCFDTYMVYYSGHVLPNGDWALADNSSLKLSTILEWWREFNEESGSRLILVLDTKESHKWLAEVRKNTADFVAIQTCSGKPVRDPEEAGAKVTVGDFTKEWVNYNCSREASVNWVDRGGEVQALYAVSRRWADFRFKSPTDEDMESYWRGNFPGLVQPLVRRLNVLYCPNLFSCCHWCLACFGRLRLRWLAPVALDTGHGFKLVNYS